MGWIGSSWSDRFEFKLKLKLGWVGLRVVVLPFCCLIFFTYRSQLKYISLKTVTSKVSPIFEKNAIRTGPKWSTAELMLREYCDALQAYVSNNLQPTLASIETQQSMSFVFSALLLLILPEVIKSLNTIDEYGAGNLILLRMDNTGTSLNISVLLT